MARCEICGKYYDELAFQVVVRATQAVDTVECAHRARQRAVPTRRDAAPSPYSDLASLEQIAAELFVARAELEEERRQRQELQRENIQLAGQLDDLAQRFGRDGAPARRRIAGRELRR